MRRFFKKKGKTAARERTEEPRDKDQLIRDLRERMMEIQRLTDEPHFSTSDDTIHRYLQSSSWNVKEAEANLRCTIEHRRKLRPLTLQCTWCRDKPGFHSMRQVGQDEHGRPVMYSNFAQCSSQKQTVDNVVAHTIYLVENAKATMGPGATQWVFLIDCTGMSLSSCSPKLALSIGIELSNHYPERLGLIICVNYNAMFHTVWKATKKIAKPSTLTKIHLLHSDDKIQQTFGMFFSEELCSWLLEEIAMNKQKPLPLGQREFWKPPIYPQTHDPRGCQSYIRQYVDTFRSENSQLDVSRGKQHCPHPNIIDVLPQPIKTTRSLKESRREKKGATVDHDDSDDDDSVEESERHDYSADTHTSSSSSSSESDSESEIDIRHKRLLRKKNPKDRVS